MKTSGMISAVAFLICLAGCSLYRNDRQYIWDSEYQEIRDLYDACGSVTVVEKVLRDKRWTRAQINEVRYRLAQDYSLDEKGVPRGIDRPRAIVPKKQAMGTQTGTPFGAPKKPLSAY